MVKPLHDRIAEVQARKDKLNAQLNQLAAKAKQEDQKRETKRRLIVGGAVLDALEHEPALAAEVRKVLAKVITREQDRTAVADLIGGAAPALPA